MVARNDITGDSIQSRISNEKYETNFDNIFQKSKKLSIELTVQEWQNVLADVGQKLKMIISSVLSLTALEILIQGINNE